MNYWPEVTGIGPYTTALAEDLVAAGYEVAVVTTFPHYPHWEWQDGRKRRRTTDRRNGVTIQRVRHLLPRGRSLLRRLLYDTSFAMLAPLEALLHGRQDLIVCVSPPAQCAFTMRILSAMWRRPTVLVVEDLPVAAAEAVGLLRSRILRSAARAFEALTYRWQSHIVVIAEAFATHLKSLGVRPERITVVPHWVDTDRIRPMPRNPDYRRAFKASDDAFVVVYSGNVGEKQGLDVVVEAARLTLEQQLPIRYVIMGDGSYLPHLMESARTKNVENIVFLPLQSSNDYPAVLASADALLLTQRDGVLDSVAPSKLLSYMAAGRPVIAAVNAKSVAADAVREAACGLLVEPERPRLLVEACESLRRSDSVRRAAGERGRRFAVEHFSRQSSLRVYRAIFTDLGLPAPHGEHVPEPPND